MLSKTFLSTNPHWLTVLKITSKNNTQASQAQTLPISFKVHPHGKPDTVRIAPQKNIMAQHISIISTASPSSS